MDEVQLKALAAGHEVKSVFMPHCTWDKFGDILANAGGRSFGLFDELVSFFSTMNVYSTSKMQLSDTKEYQDFLQLFTGKSKTRETSMKLYNFMPVYDSLMNPILVINNNQNKQLTVMKFTCVHTSDQGKLFLVFFRHL